MGVAGLHRLEQQQFLIQPEQVGAIRRIGRRQFFDLVRDQLLAFHQLFDVLRLAVGDILFGERVGDRGRFVRVADGCGYVDDVVVLRVARADFFKQFGGRHFEFQLAEDERGDRWGRHQLHVGCLDAFGIDDLFARDARDLAGERVADELEPGGGRVLRRLALYVDHRDHQCDDRAERHHPPAFAQHPQRAREPRRLSRC